MGWEPRQDYIESTIMESLGKGKPLLLNSVIVKSRRHHTITGNSELYTLTVCLKTSLLIIYSEKVVS